MGIVLAALLLVILAIVGLGGRFGARFLLKKRDEARDREFRIAAGNLEGIDVEVPAAPGTSAARAPKKRGRFGRAIWGESYYPELWDEAKETFNLLPAKVDRFLRYLKDARDTDAEFTRLIGEVEAAEADSTIGNPLSEQSPARWWSVTTEKLRRKRSLSRQYFLAWKSYGPLVSIVNNKKNKLLELLELAGKHDTSFLSEEGKLALDTAQMIVPSIELRSEPGPKEEKPAQSEDSDSDGSGSSKKKKKPKRQPPVEVEAEPDLNVDIEALKAEAQRLREHVAKLEAQPSRGTYDYGRRYRIEDATREAEAAETKVEDALDITRAAELSEQLPELVQKMVADTKAAMRLYRAARQVENDASNLRRNGIEAPHPKRPVEHDVQEFIAGALDWLARVEALERDFPPACIELRNQLDVATTSIAAVRTVLSELAPLEKRIEIVYEDERKPSWESRYRRQWHEDEFTQGDRFAYRRDNLYRDPVNLNQRAGEHADPLGERELPVDDLAGEVLIDDRSPVQQPAPPPPPPKRGWLSGLLWFGSAPKAQPIPQPAPEFRRRVYRGGWDDPMWGSELGAEGQGLEQDFAEFGGHERNLYGHEDALEVEGRFADGASRAMHGIAPTPARDREWPVRQVGGDNARLVEADRLGGQAALVGEGGDLGASYSREGGAGRSPYYGYARPLHGFQPYYFKPRPPPEEPAYEKPAAPRLRQRWYLTDQAQAYVSVADAALRHCDEEVRDMSRFAQRGIRAPAEVVPAGADDGALRAEIMAGLRKLGFALAQQYAAEQKMASLNAISWDDIPSPSVRVTDANAYVQAVRSWNAQRSHQALERSKHEQQLTAARVQLTERKEQVESARQSLASFLLEKDLFEDGVSSALKSIVRMTRVLLVGMDSSLASKLKSKAEKEHDRLEAIRQEKDRERRKWEKEQWHLEMVRARLEMRH